MFIFTSLIESALFSLHSFCKGRTLYSVVRDTKNTLDINKTRQIAQEIVKVHFPVISYRSYRFYVLVLYIA